MERDTRYGLDGTTVYTWATTGPDAATTAATFTGIPKTLLTAHSTGLLRPGSYDVDGNMVDGYNEETGNTIRRYAVTRKDSK